MAVLFGANVISADIGRKLDSAEVADLGRCRRVVADKDNTTFVEGAGDEDAISARIGQLKSQAEDTSSDYDREKLEERAAKLAGGVAVLKVGAYTEVELREKRQRLEDALSATRAAIEEGIVAGGGTSLVRAAQGGRPQAASRGRRVDRRRHTAEGRRGPAGAHSRQRRCERTRCAQQCEAGLRRLRLRRRDRAVRRAVGKWALWTRPRSPGRPWKTPPAWPAWC